MGENKTKRLERIVVVVHCFVLLTQLECEVIEDFGVCMVCVCETVVGNRL